MQMVTCPLVVANAREDEEYAMRPTARQVHSRSCCKGLHRLPPVKKNEMLPHPLTRLGTIGVRFKHIIMGVIVLPELVPQYVEWLHDTTPDCPTGMIGLDSIAAYLDETMHAPALKHP